MYMQKTITAQILQSKSPRTKELRIMFNRIPSKDIMMLQIAVIDIIRANEKEKQHSLNNVRKNTWKEQY